MATAPQPPHKPAAPQQHQKPADKPSDKKDDKNHAHDEDKHGHTLRDPAEGKPPAVLGEQQGRDTPRQTIGVKGEPIEDGERDPDTVAEEQRRRAAEMERVGVEAWKAAHDERSPEQRGEHAHLEGAQRRVEHHGKED